MPANTGWARAASPPREAATPPERELGWLGNKQETRRRITGKTKKDSVVEKQKRKRITNKSPDEIDNLQKAKIEENRKLAFERKEHLYSQDQ